MINISVSETCNRNYLVCRLMSIMFSNVRVGYEEGHECESDVNVYVNMRPHANTCNHMTIIDDWSLAEDFPLAYIMSKTDVCKKIHTMCSLLNLHLTDSYDDKFVKPDTVYLPSRCVKVHEIFSEFDRRLLDSHSEQYVIDDNKTPFIDKTVDYVAMTMLHTLLLP